MVQIEVRKVRRLSRVELGDHPVTIGRSSQNSVVLSDLRVSRTHCVIERIEGSPRIRDLESRYGTFVNGKKVKESALADGDKIRVGPFEITFQDDAAKAASAANNGALAPTDDLEPLEVDADASAARSGPIGLADDLSDSEFDHALNSSHERKGKTQPSDDAKEAARLLELRALELDRRERQLERRQASIDDRERELRDQRDELERQREALVIGQAAESGTDPLNGEAPTSDLTAREDELARRAAELDDRAALLDQRSAVLGRAESSSADRLAELEAREAAAAALEARLGERETALVQTTAQLAERELAASAERGARQEDASLQAEESAALMRELEELRGRLGEVESRLASEAEQRAAVEAELTAAREQIAVFGQRELEGQRLLAVAQREGADWKQAAEAAERRMAEGAMRIAELEASVADVQAQIDTLNAEHSHESTAAQQQIAERSGEVDRLAALARTLEERLDESQSAQRAAEQKAALAQRALQTLTAQVQQIEHAAQQVSELESNVQEIENVWVEMNNEAESGEVDPEVAEAARVRRELLGEQLTTLHGDRHQAVNELKATAERLRDLAQTDRVIHQALTAPPPGATAPEVETRPKKRWKLFAGLFMA